MADCYNKIYLKDKDIEVECGKCLNCIANKKKEKALRLIHEMNDFRYKYFITLTMNELNATRCKDGRTEIRKKDLTAYIKHLQYWAKRYSCSSKYEKIKYIACGEYGARTDRAHYHIVLLCNTLLLGEIKRAWKKGHVQVEALKDVKGVYYTAGYTDKKTEIYFKDKYKKDKDNREIAFLKVSNGNGKKWINEAIAARKISPKSYFVDSFNGKNKLPIYYKQKYKEAIMGVRAIYKRYTDAERKYFADNNIKNTRKTYMVNQEEYEKNYWKWEIISNKIKLENLKRDAIYYKFKEMKQKYGDNWKQRMYNLMFNEKYNDMNEYEREFTNLMKRRRELLKIKAEQKYFAKLNNRKAV